MPEYPDVSVYVECLQRRIQDEILEGIQIVGPALLRSVDPPLREAEGRRVTRVERLGKRIVIGLEEDLFLVVHLMIAGRLRWRAQAARASRKTGLAAFQFSSGTLLLTEASPRKRASLYLVCGEASLRAHDPGGLNVLELDTAHFRAQLLLENRTLKRALTDPRLFDGIGNAYSDEILHRAGLSPVRLTRQLDADEVERLRVAACETLEEWKQRLHDQVRDGFPEKVTAFRPEMAVHGRYKEPCPVCGSAVQRIVYAANETNYCPTCQTGGKLLADRALSRLLKKDWPHSLEELEERIANARDGA